MTSASRASASWVEVDRRALGKDPQHNQGIARAGRGVSLLAGCSRQFIGKTDRGEQYPIAQAGSGLKRSSQTAHAPITCLC